EQVHAIAGADHRVERQRPETVDGSPTCINRLQSRPGVRKVALPGSGSIVLHIAVVARGREIQRTACGHAIDRLRNDAVLKWRFIKIIDIVNNDVAAVAAEVQNVLGETGFAVIRRGEVKLSAGSQVMNDLQHGGAFARTL